MGIITVLWEKWTEFKRDFYKITVAAMIAPLMYLLVFGLGIQTMSHGEPYLNFLIPGIVSMVTMTGSFGAVAQNMSVQRLYEKALDQIMVSPTPLWQFIVGQIVGGALNGTVFSTIALTLSFLAKSYTDAPRFNTYIIMPMSFLCNTFFSTDQMPHGIREFVSALPLSQTSDMVRSIAQGGDPSMMGFVILGIYLVVFSAISFAFIYRKKNL